MASWVYKEALVCPRNSVSVQGARRGPLVAVDLPPIFTVVTPARWYLCIRDTTPNLPVTYVSWAVMAPRSWLKGFPLNQKCAIDGTSNWIKCWTNDIFRQPFGSPQSKWVIPATLGELEVGAFPLISMGVLKGEQKRIPKRKGCGLWDLEEHDYDVVWSSNWTSKRNVVEVACDILEQHKNSQEKTQSCRL